MVRRALIVGMAVLSLGTVLSTGIVPARAHHPLTTTDVATVGLTFVPGDDQRPTVPLEVARFGALRFTNADFDLHTLTSFTTLMGEPLFDSGPVGPGATVEVSGVATLEAGEYRFSCSVHPPMTGRLRVVPRRILTPR